MSSIMQSSHIEFNMRNTDAWLFLTISARVDY